MTQPTIEEPLGRGPDQGPPRADTTLPPSLPPQLSPRAIARARRRQAAGRAWSEYRRNSIGMVGLAVLVLFVAMAVFAPLLVPESELDVTKATGTPFSPPERRVPARDRRERPLGAGPDHLGLAGVAADRVPGLVDLGGDRLGGRHRRRPLRPLARLGR